MAKLCYILICCFALASAMPTLPNEETPDNVNADQVEVQAENIPVGEPVVDVDDTQRGGRSMDTDEESDILDAINEEPSELIDEREPTELDDEDIESLDELQLDDVDAAQLSEAEAADPSLAIRVRLGLHRPMMGLGYIPQPLLIRQRLYPSFRLRYRLLPLLRFRYGMQRHLILRRPVLPTCIPCMSGMGVTCC